MAKKAVASLKTSSKKLVKAIRVVKKDEDKGYYFTAFFGESLGSELNFSHNPEIIDSVLMLIPDDNIISFSDNIFLVFFLQTGI